ncbi:dna glycosylase [Stemphylium lycopersici]|uniref:Endonuclease III homolog n=1 Tax=Stemphylium lycopersici TaxID=183478 RepID=A0A364NDB9_STELY|nr:dna glycosylase [Stemphylium lycopersici]RAR15270.1 dna glycosylase [Stemphylium lycopersici]
MRTSRISRDTSRIIAASRTQRTLRQTRSATTGDTKPSHVKKETADGTNGDPDSELSPVPSDAGSDGEAERAPKKRKRGQDAPVVVKREVEESSIAAIASPQKDIKVKKARRAPAKKTKASDGSVKIEPPANWEEIYALTREMRNENVAPVDTMGCESLADRSKSPRDQRFQTLVALMLSSQTKDTVTAPVMRGMQENMPGGFNLESVLALEPAQLNAFINKVGFHNLKTKYIKQTAEILRDKWNSEIPDTIEGLVSLPGVGPKMAYLTLSAAWGRTEGIGVDVHVHRITNLWGWHKTQQPEQTRAALESWLPKDKWHDINNLLVGFGQTICLPVGRKCGDCKLAARGLCPSAVVAKGTKVKKEAVVKVEAPGGDAIVQEKVVGEVKIEDVGSTLQDIEDIGKEARKRITRKKQKSQSTDTRLPLTATKVRDRYCNMEGYRRDSPGPAPARPALSSTEPTVGGRMVFAEHISTPCLVYFVTVLATFQVGVAIVSNVVSPQYERVKDQLHAHSSALHKERIIHSRLEAVLASQLKRGFMDTHEDCLVRGLEKADHELLGLGFRYPDVRDQVVEWTMENCGRLQFVPQVVIEEPTTQEAVLTYWATVSYRALNFAEKAVGFVKQKFGWMWACLRSSSPPSDVSRVEGITANANMSTSEQILPERTLPQVPYGFVLGCGPGQPCRLFYPDELAARFDQAKVSPEFLAQLKSRTETMRTIHIKLAQVQATIIKASVMVSYLEIPLLVCCVIAFVNSITLKTIPSREVPGKEDMYLAKSVLMEQATHLAIVSLDKSPAIFPILPPRPPARNRVQCLGSDA